MHRCTHRRMDRYVSRKYLSTCFFLKTQLESRWFAPFQGMIANIRSWNSIVPGESRARTTIWGVQDGTSAKCLVFFWDQDGKDGAPKKGLVLGTTNPKMGPANKPQDGIAPWILRDLSADNHFWSPVSKSKEIEVSKSGRHTPYATQT